MGNNMEAPERIRVAQDEDGFWTCREAISGSPEYIRADLAAPSAPAEIEGLVLPEMFGVCQRCEENEHCEEVVCRLEDLRHDGEVWSCEDCWNPDESESWADAPQAATALTAQQAENERLRGEVETLQGAQIVNRNAIRMQRAAREKAEAERDAWKANAKALAQSMKDHTAMTGSNSSWMTNALAAHAKLKGES